MGSGDPLVSVIIPTFHRPELVVRAAASALDQSKQNLEVIVVVDGRDDATCRGLNALGDPRLRVVIPAHHFGNAGARNAGIAEAVGKWVAFLDDDDLWLPGKLDLQVRAAESSPHRFPIISCRLIARGTRDFVWPRRLPRPREPLSEYLFCRSSPFTGEGMVQTSTILTATELLRQVAFRNRLRRYVDLDWLLRAARVPGVGVEFVPEVQPLTVWHIEEDRPRVSNGGGTRDSLDWARANRELFTPRAYAALLLTLISSSAARDGDWRAFVALPAEAWRRGAPRPMDLATHAAHFLLPRRLKGWAAAASTSLKAG